MRLYPWSRATSSTMSTSRALSGRHAKKSLLAIWSDQKTPTRLPPNAVMVEMSSGLTFVAEIVMNVNEVPPGAVYPTLI